jgi:hypothetical protein
LKSVLYSVAWLFLAAGLYAGIVLLEFYWNMPEWRPLFDSVAAFLVAWCVAMVAMLALLARRTRGRRFTKWFSLLLSLGLASLTWFLLPAEAVSDSLFGRNVTSPLWYRGGRAILLLAPLAMWLWFARFKNALPVAPGEPSGGMEKPR